MAKSSKHRDEPASERATLTEMTPSQLMFSLEHALSWLEANRNEVNDLNVFPVPDGDTGSNMFMTFRSALDEAKSVSGSPTVDDVMKAIAHGALMGARGNSGVILSQIIRGFAQGLGPRQIIHCDDFVQAWSDAAAVAYRAVMKPTEGTMLTVVRVIAERARSTERRETITEFFEDLVVAAHEAVEATPDQLAILKEAGVVDAGGFGLAIIVEGMWHAMQSIDPKTWNDDESHELSIGAPLVRNPERKVATRDTKRERTGASAVGTREHGWGFCTEFLVHDVDADPEDVKAALSALGESAVIVGDRELVRVHIHSFDPNMVIATAATYGRLSKLKVDDMSKQHHDILESAQGPETGERTPVREIAVVSVAQGDGFHELMKSLGAEVVVEGGQTMNPSIEDLLVAVRDAHAEHIVLLPNNGNVVMTADQVRKVSTDEGLDVRVLPTKTIPEGIAALFAFEGDGEMDAVISRMSQSVEATHSVEVTHAVRDTSIDGKAIKEGDFIAIVDERVVGVGKSAEEVLIEAIRSAKPAPELVTAYYGSETEESDAEVMLATLKRDFPTIEFELHRGGQSHYPFIVSLE